MDPRASRLRNVADCSSLAENVLKGGLPRLAEDCRKRTIQIRAELYGVDGDLERECVEAIYAYEEILSARAERRQPASRTWPMIKKWSVIEAVDRVVTNRKVSTGFAALESMGLKDYAFEAVILRHPGRFSSEAVQVSHLRMDLKED